MTLPHSIREHLENSGAAFQILHHPRTNTLEQAAQAAHIEPSSFARAVLLGDTQGLVMAILPINTAINLNHLNEQMGRSLRVLKSEEADGHFPDCEPGSHPPLPDAFPMSSWLDESLIQQEVIAFEPGERSSIVTLPVAEFKKLCSDVQVLPIATPIPANDGAHCRLAQEDLQQLSDNWQPPKDAEVQQRIKEIYKLPAIPAVAVQILQIASQPHSTAKELAELVEMDPSIAAQVIRYARSSFFGYQGRVDTIETAITRVLGFDIVSNLALGIAAGQVFQIKGDGPLGLERFWTHAVYTAAMAQQLGRHLGPEQQVNSGTAYLCGLLHNFGVLLLGHLFQPEYYLLNKLSLANPGCSLPAIEEKLLTLGGMRELHSLAHTKLGAWLMSHWNMPEELITVTEYHHHSKYDGAHAAYVHMIVVCNHLLAERDISDVADATLPSQSLDLLNLTETKASAIAKEVYEGSDELDRMAELMAKNQA